MDKSGTPILVSTGFLAGLCTLLLNDLIFKEQFHNSFTGKLSDFAGLLVFPLFWTAFVPRLKLPIYILSALSFAYWKSEYSQPLIDVWNHLQLFQLSRTVDYGDLIALTVLPLSYIYSCRERKNYPSRISLCAISIISLAAFTATSFSKDTQYDNEYSFQTSKAALITQIKNLRAKYEPSPRLLKFDGDTFEVSFDSCVSTALIKVREQNGLAVIKLNKINFRCPGGGDSQEMLQYFEKEFIEKLKGGQADSETQILYIYPSSTSDTRAQPSPK